MILLQSKIQLSNGKLTKEQLHRLRDLDWEKVPHAFQIKLHRTAWKRGYTIKEVPIVFSERREGDSKMSTAISLEAAWRVLRLAAIS